MKKIPNPILTKHLRGACPEQKALFAATFPKGMAITEENVVKALRVGLEVEWGLKRWLPATLLAEYQQQDALLWAEYARQSTPLLVEYQRQHAPLWAEYERQPALLVEYQRQLAPLWAEYERQSAPFWAEYQRQKDPLIVNLALAAMITEDGDE